MKQLFKKIILCLSISLLSACDTHDKNVFKVGTISGPETDLMQIAQDVAKKQYDLDVKIVEFTDYLQPNAALNDGSIDANMFQHQPFLDQQIKDKNYKIKTIAKTFVYPMGIYSNKIKNLSELPEKSLVALPNDTSNEGRALLLLQKAHLVKLKKEAGIYATPADIIENPKNLTFKELDASQVARSLPDVMLAVINTNYAVAADLNPAKDAIFLEGKDSPYANIIVIRDDEINDPRVKEFVAAFQSQEVMDAAKQIFKGQAIPAW
jgi:D-methionine transport system substrate-binding protein